MGSGPGWAKPSLAPQFRCLCIDTGVDPEIFQREGGGLRRKILKEKCLLIHISTREHIKTRQTCNSFSLLPFQEDCLLFFALYYRYYSLLFLKFERGGGLQPP